MVHWHQCTLYEHSSSLGAVPAAHTAVADDSLTQRAAIIIIIIIMVPETAL
jgi:hypothetical protein